MGHEAAHQPTLPTTADALLRGRSPRPSGARDTLSSDIPATDGNLAVARALAAYRVHAKQIVSQPGDPDEEEADGIADTVVSRSSAPAIQRKSDACASGNPCWTCEEEAVHAKRATGGAAPSSRNASPAVDAISSGGVPLPPDLRASYVSRCSHELSSMRLHLGTQASASARTSRFPQASIGLTTAKGQRRQAHELSHVMQGDGMAVDRRGALDPSNTAAWDWYGGFAEACVRHYFTNVRVHDDGEAAALARSVKARTYTAGDDTVFRANEYSRETVSGRQLLTHELVLAVPAAVSPIITTHSSIRVLDGSAASHVGQLSVRQQGGG